MKIGPLEFGFTWPRSKAYRLLEERVAQLEAAVHDLKDPEKAVTPEKFEELQREVIRRRAGSRDWGFWRRRLEYAHQKVEVKKGRVA